MSTDDAYRLDIQSADVEPPDQGGPAKLRPWLGVMFECCSVYTRLYPNQSNTSYEGPCPLCGRRVNIKIGPGGTNSRFFRAS